MFRVRRVRISTHSSICILPVITSAFYMGITRWSGCEAVLLNTTLAVTVWWLMNNQDGGRQCAINCWSKVCILQQEALVAILPNNCHPSSLKYNLCWLEKYTETKRQTSDGQKQFASSAKCCNSQFSKITISQRHKRRHINLQTITT